MRETGLSHYWDINQSSIADSIPRSFYCLIRLWWLRGFKSLQLPHLSPGRVMTWSPHWHWAHPVFMTIISFHLPSRSWDKMLDYVHGLPYPAGLTKHHVSKCGWQRNTGRNNHVLEKLHSAIMSWFAICHVSFQKHSNKHESCKHESGQTRPPANTIFTRNFSISQNFPQTNLLKMTLLQLTYSGEIICKKIASCPNESPH